MTMTTWLIIIAVLGAGAGLFAWLTNNNLKSTGEDTGDTDNQEEQEAEQLSYSDAAWPWFGVQNGCVSLKSGGAALLARLEGFDYASADEFQLDALNSALAEALKAATATGGYGASSGITASICAQVSHLDIGDLRDNIQRAEQNVTHEPGLAAQALLDAEYLGQRAATTPFVQRKYYLALTLTSAALQKELLAARQEEEAERVWQEQMEELAHDLHGGSNSRHSSSSSFAKRSGGGEGADDDLDLALFSFEGLEGGGDNDEEEAALVGQQTTTDAEKRAFLNSFIEGSSLLRQLFSLNPDRAGSDEASLLQKSLGNLKEAWDEVFGGARRLQLGGSITAHPVPQLLAQTLRHKLETVLLALQPFGVSGRILDSKQTAEALAELLYLPNRPASYYADEIIWEARRVGAVVRFVREHLNRTATPDRILDQLIRQRLDELNREQKQAQIEQAERLAYQQKRKVGSGSSHSTSNGGGGSPPSLYEPKNGDPNGPVDGSAFGSVPVEFGGAWVKVGVPEEVEIAQARLVVAIRAFQSLPRKPHAALRYLETVLAEGGRREGWPKPSYFTTLYVNEWPRQVPVAVLYSLLARSGLQFSVNLQIKTLTKNKAQKKLNRARDNIESAARIDKDRKSLYERSFAAASIDELQAQLATDDGVVNMVGLRICVRADSPARLKRDSRQIASILAGQGLKMTETNFRQAFGLFSALPIGVDYLGNSLLTGNRTLRNMVAETTACFFPALITDKAADGGVLIGHDESGALVRASERNLINPHSLVCGMSGSGKTVSKLIKLIRLLYSNPKVRIRFIDPQDVTSRIVAEVDGTVANVAGDGSVRFNFLDRFSLGGRPQVFGDLCDVFTTMLVLMQRRSLSDAEHTALKTLLNVMFYHFEQGENATPYIMRSLFHRFGDALGFQADPTGQRYFKFEQTIEGIYSHLSQEYHVPSNGFVVRLKRDPQTGEIEQRSYATTAAAAAAAATSHPNNGDGNGNGNGTNRANHNSNGNSKKNKNPHFNEVLGGGAEAFSADSILDSLNNTEPELIGESEPGVVLEVLNTYTGAYKRNMYAGGGYTEIEIPVSAFNRLYQAVMERGWGQMENEGWLAFLLVSYLAGPFPRRAAGNPQWITPDPPSSQEERVAAQVPGSQVRLASGPIWYAEDDWYGGLVREFSRHLSQSGFLTYLDRATREKVERDLMVGLRRGTPILSDVIPFLASEPSGMAMAANLEPFCNPNIHGGLFNGHTNLDIRSRFFSFNVKGLTDQLRPLRMMQCVELTWREIAGTPRSAGLEYIVVWDEYGTIATQAPEVATYIGLTFKRARALGGKIIVMEQNYQTFLTPAGRFVLENAGVIEVMRQNTSYAADFWGSEYSLSGEDRRRLMSAKKGEGIILQMEEGGIRKTWVQHSAHPLTLQLLSTKPSDVEQYEREQREAMGLDPVGEMLRDVLPQN